MFQLITFEQKIRRFEGYHELEAIRQLKKANQCPIAVKCHRDGEYFFSRLNIAPILIIVKDQDSRQHHLIEFKHVFNPKAEGLIASNHSLFAAFFNLIL